MGVSPRLLAPNEHLTGTQHAPQLLAELLALRADAGALTGQHPTLTFLPLPVALRRWRSHGLTDAPFHAGLALLRPRYARLGLSRLLPLDRVLVGVQSSRPDAAYGGFHHPNQGYRHLQMYALVTMAGDLSAGLPQDPELAALDLLRCYAHDCLHYGSFRSYQLQGGQLVRAQYGLNFRRGDGRTYSAPDATESVTTRNLGIVMEGACDREARLLTQAAARRSHVTRTDGMPALVFREITAALDACDVDVLRDPDARAAVAPVPAAAEFLRAMAGYHQGVNGRYSVFLDEVGGDDGAEDLHTLLLTAMISGDLRRVSGWLTSRHGRGAFARTFKAARYHAT